MMPVPRMICAIAASITIAGCVGTLKTHPASEVEASGNYDGILFYPSILMEEVSQTTVRTENGKIVATNAGSPALCRPITTSKLIVAADFTRPRIMNYEHGILEGYVFNATFADGMLASVNTTSTPDQGKTIANLAGAAKDLASVAAAAAPRPGPPQPPPAEVACNDGNVAVARRPYRNQ
jgi:hypothetical protein